ncbi:MAG: gliding motility-associated C-terminal domain-containing protein [Bacteroidia bacterium]|nr:gliding motility-associated C-terminal domain-containing protein [Bacteroidia bacterium]
MRNLVYIFVFLNLLTNAGNPSIIFKENKGQWPEKVLFGTEILNTKFYVNKNSFNYCVYNPEEYIKIFGRHKSDEKPSVVHGHNYEVTFVGADLTKFIKKEEQSDYYNYFLGKDRNKWASNVKAFGNVLFNEIYKGIDIKLYSSNINLKYDFIIKPNANVNSIQLNFNYTDGIEIINDELVINTSAGNIIEKAPYSYQIINGIKKQVKCKYALLNKTTIGFSFPEGYNKNYELIIDPVVVVCSYSGATCYSFGDCCTYDANGNIYVGAEADYGYPSTPGAFQLNNQTTTTAGWGLIDIVISVYNSNGTSKIFSTYLGGDYGDWPGDIMVKNNEIIILGGTLSETYPCTSNAFDTTFNSVVGTGDYDITISKLNMTGTTLLASTYIGGTKSEIINNFNASSWWWGWVTGEMECDDSGNVYVIGSTNSNNFPVTAGVISPTLQGTSDAYVFKIDNTLSNLIWSTYLGGSLNENGTSIKLDGSGGVYCYGSTSSANFPTTVGAYNTTKNGFGTNADLYISHINSTGTAFISSTFLGTNVQDYSGLMNLDKNNNVYLTANLSSTSSFTPSSGTYSNPNGYNCIYKLNTSLSSLAFKTKFGFPPLPVLPTPSPNLFFSALKIDSCENIYIGGFAANMLPTTPNALQPYGGGSTDLYIAQFKQNCSSLAFASFFGGATNISWSSSNTGESTGLSDFDNKGYYYSSVGIPGGLPVTPNAYATTPVNTSTLYPSNDAFVKIDMQSHINASSSYGGNITGCPPFSTHFVSTTNTGTSYWDLGDGTTTNFDTITHTYNNLGTYNVLLVVTDTNTCQRTDSIKSILNVINPTEFNLEDVQTCLNTPSLLQANVSAVTYSWSTGQTTPNIYVNQLGSYTLTINNGGCNSSDVVNVVLGELKLSERFPNVITPNGDNINDWIDFINYNFDEVEFYVYDRWGRERYKITKPDEKWNPNDLDNGTYYYVANYKSSCTGKFGTDKGFISVFK